MAMPIPEPPVETGAEPDGGYDDYGAVTTEVAFSRFSAAAPRGWHVELIEGEIQVTPPANGEHEEYVSELSDQVTLRRKDAAVRSYANLGLAVPGVSGVSRVVPDLVVASKGSFDDTIEWHDPSPVLLVAEVTSAATAGNDRVKKIRGYARAGIPVYLLVDRDAKEIAVCTEPAGDDYGVKTIHKLGARVPLPEPLGFELDSSQF